MTGRDTLAGLNAEWRELASRPLDDWPTREPALAGVDDFGGLLTVIRRRPDAVLGALLRLGAQGEVLAHRVVLQAMLGMLVRRYAQAPHLLEEAIGELWLVIVEYPVGRRPRSIAANLSWGVWRRLPRPLPCRPWDDLDPPAPAPQRDAASTLREARALGLIDEPTHRVLWTVYVAGRSSAEAARELGTTAELVRWRCSKTLRRLAGQAELLSA